MAMRALRWSVTLLFAAPALFAQQPQPAPPLNPSIPDPLLSLLQQWEQKMKAIKAIEATIVRTETDPVTNDKRVFEGTAKLLRPDRADLYLTMKGNPQVYERFLLTGNFLYQFEPKKQLIRVYTVPQRAPGQPAIDDNFLGLLFGMSVQEVQRRYQLQLVKTDANYHYIVVTPQLAADKAEFAKARLVLWQQSMLPRQIEFVATAPTDKLILWDVPKVDTNPRIGPANFQKPPLPKGWKVEMERSPAAASQAPAAGPGTPAAPPPSKVRPSGGN
jgi:TIGR03009 family protein